MPRLTEQEKQEVVRFLETDRPLPEKYRFLLFDDKREVELVWNGKTSEVTSVVLPFQTIEQIDEPRSEGTRSASASREGTRSASASREGTRSASASRLTGSGTGGGGEQGLLFDVDARGRQLKGWTNKLIWGDNKLVLSSLKNGPLREEIERQGGLKLIYIDPPFDVGADFSMDIEIGDETFTKNPGILEEIAYRDTWGRGADSFISMIYERLILMHDLLAENGSIFVHCDWRMNSFIRLALDEIFGKSLQRNEILWCYSSPGRSNTSFASKHNTIYWYSKTDSWIFNGDDVRIPMVAGNTKYNEGTTYGVKVVEKDGKRYRVSKSAGKEYWYDIDRGKIPEDWWTDIQYLQQQITERIDYPTQKPEGLIQRIVKACTNEGDLVADFFCGSGTTAAVAEKHARRWIVSDLGKFAVHTTRKRMIGVQRQLKAEGKNYRAFEILNLGKYERQHYVGLSHVKGGGDRRYAGRGVAATDCRQRGRVCRPHVACVPR
jgi:site-specific DNA-methyltransferase (adenine-specific)/adenine-specific DNA-methyltransferase